MSTEYEIALSFAGEDREYVSEVAHELRRNKVSVFYDEYETATLWGKDLYQHLSKIYSEMAKFTIVFISKHYAKKLWTKHELKNAQERAFKESKEYILPVKFDDTNLSGILETTGYIDLRKITPIQLSKIILDKLNLEKPSFDFKHQLLTEDIGCHRQHLLSVCLEPTINITNVAVLNLERYSTLNEILDDLFIHYLKNNVSPYSYGSKWILTTEPFRTRIIAPLKWITSKRKSLSEIDPMWALNVPLENVGVYKGSYLEVDYFQYPTRARVYGVLTNDYKLCCLLNSDAKAIALLMRANKFIPSKTITAEQIESYKYHLVYRDWLSVCNTPFLIDNGKPLEPVLVKLIER